MDTYSYAKTPCCTHPSTSIFLFAYICIGAGGDENLKKYLVWPNEEKALNFHQSLVQFFFLKAKLLVPGVYLFGKQSVNELKSVFC